MVMFKYLYYCDIMYRLCKGGLARPDDYVRHNKILLSMIQSADLKGFAEFLLDNGGLYNDLDLVLVSDKREVEFVAEWFSGGDYSSDGLISKSDIIATIMRIAITILFEYSGWYYRYRTHRGFRIVITDEFIKNLGDSSSSRSVVRFMSSFRAVLSNLGRSTILFEGLDLKTRIDFYKKSVSLTGIKTLLGYEAGLQSAKGADVIQDGWSELVEFLIKND